MTARPTSTATRSRSTPTTPASISSFRARCTWHRLRGRCRRLLAHLQILAGNLSVTKTFTFSDNYVIHADTEVLARRRSDPCAGSVAGRPGGHGDRAHLCWRADRHRLQQQDRAPLLQEDLWRRNTQRALRICRPERSILRRGLYAGQAGGCLGRNVPAQDRHRQGAGDQQQGCSACLQGAAGARHGCRRLVWPHTDQRLRRPKGRRGTQEHPHRGRRKPGAALGLRLLWPHRQVSVPRVARGSFVDRTA